jgi:hypothetical protein
MLEWLPKNGAPKIKPEILEISGLVEFLTKNVYIARQPIEWHYINKGLSFLQFYKRTPMNSWFSTTCHFEILSPEEYPKPFKSIKTHSNPFKA